MSARRFFATFSNPGPDYSRSTCVCGKAINEEHCLVAAYGVWCCPDRIQSRRLEPTCRNKLCRNEAEPGTLCSACRGEAYGEEP
jgi:hypothetical protein